MSKKIKIGFCGTDKISIPFLINFLNSDTIKLNLILTKDKTSNKSRNKENNIHTFITQNTNLFDNIKILYPERMREVDENIFKDLDYVIVMAYGYKIPQRMLGQCIWINIHASILPAWRGSCPINYSLISGDLESGLTAIFMVNEIDAGDILSCIKINIDIKDNVESLTNKMMAIGPNWFINTLLDYHNNKIIPTTQNHSTATFTKLLTEKDRIIDWNKSSIEIHNQIRGLSPNIGCIANIENIRIKIIESQIENNHVLYETSNLSGTIITKDKLCVQCGSGVVRLKTIVPESSKKISDTEFCKSRNVHNKIIK